MKLRQFWRNLVRSFLINFSHDDVNIFHLTWIMSLQYLVSHKSAKKWRVHYRDRGLWLAWALEGRKLWTCHLFLGRPLCTSHFRWGGKRLYDFVANYLRKLCTKFYQNCSSFIKDIFKNILVSFFQITVQLKLYRDDNMSPVSLHLVESFPCFGRLLFDLGCGA